MVQGSDLASKSVTAKNPPIDQSSWQLVNNFFFQVLRAEDSAQAMISSLLVIQFSL